MENRRSTSRPSHVLARQPSKGLVAILTTLVILVACAQETKAAAIAVPNFSFESQSGVGQPFGVNINIDSWQKNSKPGYFIDSAQLQWIQTAGAFVDTNPYGNHDGTQAAYLLSFPGAGLFQDLTSPDAKFTIGMSYNMSLGVFSKDMTAGNTLSLSLYYRDGLNNFVTVGAPTTVTYSAAGFPNLGPLNLIDFSVNLGEVQAGDAWAGKNIGIKIEIGVSDFSGKNWDFDNVRLTATPVPEPTSMALLALGFGGFLAVRMRSRKR